MVTEHLFDILLSFLYIALKKIIFLRHLFHFLSHFILSLGGLEHKLIIVDLESFTNKVISLVSGKERG